ncbi:MAG: hypothetical protein GXO70_10060 [Acidobacteria bacterium]|nr:hypothetical protein [Acidobacteriota bacterium]
MAIKEKLAAFEEVKGYLGCGVFTAEGEMLEGTAQISGLHQEILGSLLNDVLLAAQEMTDKGGFGHSDFIQINSDMGTLLAKCNGNVDGKHYHVTLFLKPDGNVAMGKMKIKSVTEALSEEF